MVGGGIGFRGGVISVGGPRASVLELPVSSPFTLPAFGGLGSTDAQIVRVGGPKTLRDTGASSTDLGRSRFPPPALNLFQFKIPVPQQDPGAAMLVLGAAWSGFRGFRFVPCTIGP